jgi:hypothetical protein
MPRATAVAILGALVAATVAAAGAPGRWTPVSVGGVRPSDVAGVARTPDGVLHVVWQRRGAQVSALWEATVAPDASTASEVAVPQLAEPGAPALTTAPDGTLRAFFFVRAADAAGATLRFAARQVGGSWTVASDPFGQAAGADVPTVGGAASRDGTPVVAWTAGRQVRYRFGVDPASPATTVNAGGCCAAGVQPAVDQVSGQAYVAWATNAKGGAGVYVQAIGRAGPARARLFATGSATPKRKAAVLPEGPVALVSRPGAPGVYLAYTIGYPKVRRLAVLEVAARQRVLDLRAPGAGHVALAPGPQGRLWLVWARADEIYAARTNRSVSRLGAARRIPARQGAGRIDQIRGEGSAGALDLVVSFETRAGVRFWHQQVLPGLTLGITKTSGAAGATRYLFHVADAGDPIANANVRVGKQTLTTGVSGTVVLVTSDHPASATATKPGYAPGTTPLP